MQSINEFGVKGNPLTKTKLVQHWDGEGINPPPPESSLRITDGGEFRITDNDNNRITD